MLKRIIVSSIIILLFFACNSSSEKGSKAAEIQRLEKVDSEKNHTTTIAERLKQVDSNYLNVKEFGAKGDGVTNDSPAINKAIDALANSSTSTIFFPEGTYLIKDKAIHLHGNKVKLIGESQENTILKGANVADILRLRGITKDSLIISNMRFDGSRVQSSILRIRGANVKAPVLIENCVFFNGRLYNIWLSGAKNVTIKNSMFRGTGKKKGMGIYITRGSRNINIIKNTFLYLFNGVYVVGKISGKNNKNRLVKPNRNINFSNNYLDFGWFLYPFEYSGSGNSVSYTQNKLIDTKANFKNLSKRDYVRILKPLGAGNITGISNEVVIRDGNGDFSRVEPDDLIRIHDKIGLVTEVINNETVKVEQWLNQKNMLPASPPKANQEYSVYRIILGRVENNSKNRITVKRFYDFWGNIVTPQNGWRYEVLTARPNYPFFASDNNSNFTILNNTFRRGWSDQIAIYGDEAKIINNSIMDGQDMGITVHGKNHIIRGNTITHQGIKAIFINCTGSTITNNKFVDIGWRLENLSKIHGYLISDGASNNKVTNNGIQRVRIKN